MAWKGGANWSEQWGGAAKEEKFGVAAAASAWGKSDAGKGKSDGGKGKSDGGKGKSDAGKGNGSWGQAQGKGAKTVAPSWGAAEAQPAAKVVKPPTPQEKQAAAASWGNQQVWAPEKQSWGEKLAWGNQQSWEKPAGKGDVKGSTMGDAKGWGEAKGAAKGAGKGEAKGWGAAAAGPIQTAEQVRATVAKLIAEFGAAEAMANAAIASSKAAVESAQATPHALKSAHDALDAHQNKLSDLQTTLSKESGEARKVGPGAHAEAQELQKMLIKCKGVCQQITRIQMELKPKLARLQNEADLKAKEAKDATTFKGMLAKSRADAVGAENAVSAVGRQANPLVATVPEDEEEKDKKIASIETAATEALTKVEAARKDLSEKFRSIQIYAPEAKKNANAALLELQQKLTDGAKACTVYKNFRKELPRLVENHKTVTEVTEKLSGHEAAIATADGVAKSAPVTAEQVQEIDAGLEPVYKAIHSANALMQSKMRSADAVTQDKFAKLRTRGEELTKKMETVIIKIKAQRDVIKAEEAIQFGKEKIAEANKVWTACQDAELPFLTGVEVLDEDVSEPTLKACQEAATAAATAMHAGRTWIQQKLGEAKKYEKELGVSTAAALNPLLAKLHEIDGQIQKFRTETNQRRTAALLVEVMDAVKSFEKKAKLAESVGKVLAAANLEEESDSSIIEAITKTKEAVADASTSATETQKALQAKQRLPEFRKGAPMLTRIHDGLNAGSDKIRKLQSAILAGEKLLKAKAAITSGEEKVKEAEAAAEKVKKAAPQEGKTFTVQEVIAFDEAYASALKAIGAASEAVRPFINSAPTKIKATLQGLFEKANAAHKAVDSVKKDSKEKRDETLGDSFIADAEAKTKTLEKASQKLEEAEGPFLVGSTHDLKATHALLVKCDEVAGEVHAATAALRKYHGEKTKESRQFGEAVVKNLKEGFAGMDERVKKVSAKLQTFEKDSRERTRDCKMMEAAEKTDEFEADIKKTIAAVTPFEKEGAADLSEAEAAAPLKAFLEVSAESSKIMGQLRNFLGAREKEQKGNKEHTEALKKLQERVAKGCEELQAKKKVTAPHEQRALGSRLLAEVTEHVETLDAELKKATEVCAPLLEKGGEEFLVGASLDTLASVLQAHMKEKELTEEAVFKEAGGKKMSEKAFVKYLTEQAASHDQLSAFSNERRAAVFKKLSSDGKSVTEENFKGMFLQKYHCARAVAVTNQLAMEGSETVCKVERDAEVVLFGPQSTDKSGLMRSECKVDGKQGWISIKQGGGGGGGGRNRGRGGGGGGGGDSTFLQPANAFRSFCAVMDKAVNEAGGAIKKAAHSLETKMKQGGEAKDGSRLKEARDEMVKLKEPLAAAQKAIGELKDKAYKAQRDYTTKERAEQHAHIDARNAKEAAPFVDGPKATLAALQADSKALDEAAAPMAKLEKAEELQAFATPATALESAEKLSTSVQDKAKELREAIKEQNKAVAEVTPQTNGTAEAKKLLKSIGVEGDDAARRSSKTISVLRNKINAIRKPTFEPAQDAIRKHAQEKKLAPEELFDSLSSGDKITEAVFCKLLGSLEALSLGNEHAQLISRWVQFKEDGISKESFLKFVVVYYKVIKTIAFTDAVDVGACKTLRKAEEGEVVECLGGPIVDEASQMTRIRARATNKEGKNTIGWMTVSGSKGTTFLEKTRLPRQAPPKKVEKVAEKEPAVASAAAPAAA